LRAAEEINRRIIECSRDCIEVLDLQGRLLPMNAGGMEILEICGSRRDPPPLRPPAAGCGSRRPNRRHHATMLWSDIAQLGSAILLIVGAVLPVVNPLGDAPLFLNMTRGCDAGTRAELAWRITLYSFILLLGSMLLGSLVLRLFDLSIPVVQVAGGAVVCALGWNLLGSSEPAPVAPAPDSDHAKETALARAFYPLTLPLTVDPGAISVAITVGANHAHTVERVMIQIVAALIGTGIVAASILVTYRYAARVGRWIGHTGMMVMVRLSAFIVLCIGVQIGWNGVKSLLATVGIGS
jgi:multiple antibiotic resistance protein